MSSTYIDMPPAYGSIFEEPDSYLSSEYASEPPQYSVHPATLPPFGGYQHGSYDKYDVALSRENTGASAPMPLSRNDSYSYSDSYGPGYSAPPPPYSSLNYPAESSLYGEAEDFPGSYSGSFSHSEYSRERTETPSVLADRDYATGTPPPMDGGHDGPAAMQLSHASAFQKHHHRSKHSAKGVHQCWDHSCGGRVFSTHSNLLRHRREKQLGSVKFHCRKCNAAFTRTTALNSHYTGNKCAKPRKLISATRQVTI